MKRLYISLTLALLSVVITAQTLNIRVDSVTYRFPAAQTGVMPYQDGMTLTVLGKEFSLSDISEMYVDSTIVSDNHVSVRYYSNNTASVSVAGNIARFLTINRSGAHVSIEQDATLADEITYSLSGSASDGGFYTAGSYKATVELNGLTLTNVSAIYSGAAIHVQNSKRVNIKVITGTTNTLSDATSGSQKGCLYVKGHAEFKQYGTLNVNGNLKHGIKAGEYISVRNATINILSSVGDGINCEQYFLMESGSLTLSGIGDDGLQCDIEDAITGSTGQTTDHEGEDSGNIYITGGNLSITTSVAASKGIKAAGDAYISGGTIYVTTSGSGTWDTTALETKACAALAADGNIAISGGSLIFRSIGSGGKGMKCDGTLAIADSATIAITTSGGLFYSNGSTTNTNYTGDTERISNSYYSSPKGVKATGAITISGGKISVTTSGHNGEGIESKNTVTISGGEVVVNAYDDAINAASHLTISGGMVYARATNNDGIDANGNCYIQGGLIYAISASSPEVAIDANTESGYKLYVTGGTIVAIGGLESGASLSQSCYSVGSSSGGGPGGRPGGSSRNSWSANTWYALSYGDYVFAFKTPTSGGSSLVLSASSTPTLKSGVTPSGTAIFDGVGYFPASVSGGSSVTLSTYSGGNSGPGGRWMPRPDDLWDF